MSGKILAKRYELLERRGTGGMAVVYKGKDCLLNRYVAIKILKPEYIRDPKFVDNFRHESQAAARLSDPNIVSVYDVGREGNIYYIVMELMEGESLGDIIKDEAPLSEKRTIKIARQIASGLSSAHKKKIIHRDIKPHNILMTEDGTAKIADFGIAKAVSGATVVSNTTTVMGSVHYLSPEQAKGGYVDARTDIYSLGIVMYEMLTGKVPFDGDNAVTVAMMHINQDVPAPSKINPAVSKAMDAIVQKAAARHPEDRYASADELIEALDNAEKGIDSADQGATKVFGLNDFYAVEPHKKYNDGYTADSYTEPVRTSSAADGNRKSSADSADTAKKAAEQAARRKSSKKKKKKKKNKARRGKIFAVVLALICAVPLSILAYNGISSLSSGTVAVPDVLGMTEEQAASALENKGLEYELGTSVSSDKYDEGEVADTDPEAGTHVKKGSTVTLRLARDSSSTDDADKVTVPDVTKQSLSTARSMITDADLKVGTVTYKYSDSVAEGVVMSQNPGSGDKVASGSAVNITVSRGPEETTVEVPDLTGYTSSQAAAALESVGLSLGSVSEQYSDSQQGTVISQGVTAGTSVKKGQSVSIVISRGKDTSSTENNNSNNSSNNNSNSNSNSNSNNNSNSNSNSSSNGESGHHNTGGEDDNSGGVVNDESVSDSE